MDRQGIGWYGLTIVLLLAWGQVFSQVNLVPNPSFEDTIFCPFSPGDVDGIEAWIKVTGSVDYFNSCNGNLYSVPSNYVGEEFSQSGEGYVGLGPWADNFLFREFIGVSLDEPLDSGQRYLIKYHLSMADTVQYALRNFGAWFTEAQPPNDLGVLLSAEPQVIYAGEAFLDDQDGWMTIEGSFIAEGGEQFLTLGNFDDDANTDTLFVVEQTSKSAYYYLDDVSVVEDTSYHVGVDDLSLQPSDYHKLYPNPNNGSFTLWLQTEELDVSNIVVWNLTGQKVYTNTVTRGENQIDLDVSNGLYLYKITVNNSTEWTGKISIVSD